ncbi:V-type ATP synthase subunit C [Clostridium sp. SYSU_GA19001]|uniref:V-type ATP synthase subunit C n=1 Tax=Clostridium caldaquaticum TaxID=2940653 RepID=UPI0020777F89|nr:V-type ATP synthase subunit C [Clostridium caldaquaticum]MCM8709608.1 V-type ATP synthase subunit C [Clostridium caldaquaticum]
MKTTEFASIVSLIRVWESKLLTKSQYDRLIDSENLEDALKLLQETPYGSFLENDNFETALNAAAGNMYRDISKAAPYEIIVNFMKVKFDYHNIKTLIKGKILEKDFSHILIPTGIIHIDKLKAAISSEELKDLPDVIKKGIEAALKDYEAVKDPQRIDIILDKYMFSHMRQIVKDINNEFINKFLIILIDLTNIKTLLRVKKLNKEAAFFRDLLIEGGKIDKRTFNELYQESLEDISHKLSSTEYGGMLKESMEYYFKTDSLAILEKNIDNYLMNYMKKAKFINLGPEPIVVYILARETEIKNIRIILVGKLNKVSENLIRERLRDSYV